MSLFVKERLYIGEATVASIAGLILGPHCLNWFDPLSWGHSEVITLEISRIVLCVQIIAVAVELPKKYMKKHWLSVAIFLLPVMTAGWLIVGLFIWALIPHFNFAESLLVSACVTATDPVLAAAVVGKGKFAERVPGHLRNLLSAESGCNDGMAFPFIFLSLNLLIHPGNAADIVKDWILITILYQCIFGCILGAVLGYGLRKLVAFAEKYKTIDRESFLAFFVFLAFNSAGFGSILGVDDLLVSFAAGTAFGWNGNFAKKTEESHVSTVIDLIINLAFFVYFGAIIPWQDFNNSALNLNVWRLIVLAFVVIFLRRLPAVIALKPFTPDVKSWREAVFCGHFGPIGVGAIFAVILARRDLEEHFTHHSSQLDVDLEDTVRYHQLLNSLWPIVNFIVITSIVVHGSSVAVLALGKRLNRMAITMTFTNTTGNEQSANWLSRLQNLERSNTSFSLHRVDSDATTIAASNGSGEQLAQLKQAETVETSGVKYRPAGGAKRKKKGKSKKGGLMKTLSRSRTGEDEVDLGEGHERHRPQAQILQLGRPSNAPTPSDSANRSEDEDSAELKQESTESSPRSGETEVAEATAYQEGSKILIEDQNGEVINQYPVKKASKKYGNKPKSTGPADNLSIHSMESLKRQMTQFSSASDGESTGGQHLNIQRPGLPRAVSSDSRKAYYKKGDPSQRKVYAHQIDNVLLIENEEGDIIRKYRVNRHPRSDAARSRADSVVGKALSLVGIKKKQAEARPVDLEKLEQSLTPEFDAGSPVFKDRKTEQSIEDHITNVLTKDRRRSSTTVPIPAIVEPAGDDEEDSEVSEDSEYESEDTDDDMEETEVEKTRRLAALGKLPERRNDDDEED